MSIYNAFSDCIWNSNKHKVLWFRYILVFFGANLLSFGLVFFDSFAYSGLPSSINEPLWFTISVLSVLLIVIGSYNGINMCNLYFKRAYVVSLLVWCYAVLNGFLLSDLSNELLFSSYSLLSQCIIAVLVVWCLFVKCDVKCLKIVAVVMMVWCFVGCFLIKYVYLNGNFIAITLFFCFYLFTLLFVQKTTMMVLLSNIIFSILSYSYLDCRGISLCFMVCAILSIVVKINCFKKMLVFAFPLFLTIVAIFPFIFGYIYGTSFHDRLEAYSVEYFGKPLTSDRAERWRGAFYLFNNNPLASVFGYGHSVVLDYNYGYKVSASHNMFIDSVVRSGFVGLISRLSSFIVVWLYIVYIHKCKMVDVVVPIMYSFLIFISVYGFFGYTHMIATVPLSVIVPSVLNINKNA